RRRRLRLELPAAHHATVHGGASGSRYTTAARPDRRAGSASRGDAGLTRGALLSARGVPFCRRAWCLAPGNPQFVACTLSAWTALPTMPHDYHGSSREFFGMRRIQLAVCRIQPHDSSNSTQETDDDPL